MRIGSASFRNFGTAPSGAIRLCASLAASLLAVAGIAAWLMLPEPSDTGDDDVSSSSSAIILAAQTASGDTEPGQAVVQDATAPAAVDHATVGIAAPQASQPAPDAAAIKSPLDGLRIASQSWRRGGLGSKALVTLTLRNRNDFAVKDVEIACAFSRRDGSPLTARKRLIPDTIAMKSRKTYSQMLIGFVNINASKAKCSVVTASRL
ncbi:hypothetical protein IC762_21605 [Bradyrhizobium genosp. L]|uniref:hypothetical protein n=1 Tax=Bradyrhizobium genosp. L TaxID=83637 RepID=UPI0018A25795|nr:hypothetical protein [Bradyrhizobium genosp. L]QPF82355.1 hypothetical protein IC762_21605 [Bradyrhizobium genosp. L]